MALVVKNNKDANSTLNKLNKNSNALSKSLKKVSSGMKINSAADGASEYSISERMRVQIRSLDQANQNTQNGNALLTTAEGAIQSSIEILKTLKEKAINAANDTNNDESDRQMIQKELNQFLDQLDDNANIQYNGKTLNNGTLAAIDSPDTAILKGLNSQWIKNSLEMIRDAYGLSFEMNATSVHNMNVTLTDTPAMSNALAYVAVTTGSNGYASNLELVVNMSYYDDINLQDPNGSIGTNFSNMLDRTIAHEMTHAVMASNIKDFNSLPSYVIEGSAELIHGIDDERTALIASGSDDDYAGGFVFLRYVESQFSENGDSAVKRLFQALARSGGDTAGQSAAVSAATYGGYTSFADLKAKFDADKAAAGSTDAFLRQYCGINLSNDDTGAILGWDSNANAFRNKETTVPTGGTYSGWTYPSSASSYYGLTVTWPDAAPVTDASPMLKFQVGAKSQQLTAVSLGDMRAKSLGLRMQDGGANVSLESRGKAEAAIAVFDAALDYALEQQTRIGSIRARLDYTSLNLTTSSENTSASESTIRDSDMAKEMTEYTKNNVLLQASQSMLAQANQNLSSALSLLQ